MASTFARIDRDNGLLVAFVLFDVLALILSADIAHFLKFGHLAIRPDYQLLLLFAIVFVLFLFPNFNIYEDLHGNEGGVIAVRLFNAYLALGVSVITLLFVSKSSADFSRIWISSWLILGFFCSIAFKKLLIASLARSGQWENKRSVTLLGVPGTCDRIAEAVRRNASSCFRVVEIIPIDNVYFTNLESLANEISSDELWLCLPLNYGRDVVDISRNLNTYSGDVRYVPDLDELGVLNHGVVEVAGFYAINLSCSPLQGPKRMLKGIEDYGLGAVLLLVASPVMLLLAACVKLTSKGPVFYGQQRVGWNGREFTMLKFRSMAEGADSRNPGWGQASRKEVTRFGSFLRKTSLDELPQLINVLRGEMSIVGPRPERSEYVEEFKGSIPDYMRKHLVKAGITGWAQVNGLRGDTDLKERVEHDLYYIDNWSVGFDIKIIVKTVFGGFLS